MNENEIPTISKSLLAFKRVSNEEVAKFFFLLSLFIWWGAADSNGLNPGLGYFGSVVTFAPLWIAISCFIGYFSKRESVKFFFWFVVPSLYGFFHVTLILLALKLTLWKLIIGMIGYIVIFVTCLRFGFVKGVAFPVFACALYYIYLVAKIYLFSTL